MSKFSNQILGLGLVLLLTGCASLPQPAPDPVNTSTPIQTAPTSATAPPTETITPVFTPTLTGTPLPPTETATPRPPFQQVCLPVQDIPASGLRQEGVLILGGPQARLYNIKNLGHPAIPLTVGGNYFEFLNNSAISPDQKSFIYLEGSPDPKGYIPMRLSLRIVRSDGRRMAVSQPWDMRWNSIAGWLDKETLLMAWDIAYKGRMTVVDPFTGQGKDLIPTFDNVYQSHLPGTSWENATNAVYSPDLTRVVYLQDDMVEAVLQMVLWDIRTKTALWQRDDRGALTHSPRWAPGGSGFGVAIDSGSGSDSQDEIFLVSQDGGERQLTHLASPGSKAVIRGLTWSPDGKSLAFWLDYRPAPDSYETEQLAVVDTTRGEITLSCFGSGSGQPVWSLDSQALAVEVDPVNQPIQTILIDLAQASAYKLTDNAYPVGWLKAP